MTAGQAIDIFEGALVTGLTLLACWVTVEHHALGGADAASCLLGCRAVFVVLEQNLCTTPEGGPVPDRHEKRAVTPAFVITICVAVGVEHHGPDPERPGTAAKRAGRWSVVPAHRLPCRLVGVAASICNGTL